MDQYFPPKQALETLPVMRALVAAHRNLAELKGVAKTIPNEGLLISTLSLQEAQSSSEIENIITTQDALYRQQLQPAEADSGSKDVRYVDGLRAGLHAVRRTGLLTVNTILEIQAVLEGNTAGFRKTPGTVPKNQPDSLVRMAVVDHQAKAIPPFNDGNGRTEKIMNLLSLVRMVFRSHRTSISAAISARPRRVTTPNYSTRYQHCSAPLHQGRLCRA